MDYNLNQIMDQDISIVFDSDIIGSKLDDEDDKEADFNRIET